VARDERVCLQLPAFQQYYPKMRARRRIRIAAAALLATVMIGFCVIAVSPSLLDPLCDDNDWAGAPAVSSIRDAASAVNEPIHFE
jgi:hypothetical protein